MTESSLRSYYRRKASDPEKVLKMGSLYVAKWKAKQLGLGFDITEEDIEIPKVCPVLGIPLFRNIGKGGPGWNSPSIDRIDPSKGYVKDNVRVISHRANTLKNNASLEELEKILLDARRYRY
jgi:hypothetical protein